MKRPKGKQKSFARFAAATPTATATLMATDDVCLCFLCFDFAVTENVRKREKMRARVREIKMKRRQGRQAADAAAATAAVFAQGARGVG